VGTFIANAACVAGTIAGPALLVSTFGNAIFNALAVSTEESLGTRLFLQFRTIVVADMNGCRVFARGQTGFANQQILAGTIYAYEVSGTLFQTGPARPILRAYRGLVADTPEGARQTLVFYALALNGIAPFLFGTVLISKTFDAEVAQLIAKSARWAASLAR